MAQKSPKNDNHHNFLIYFLLAFLASICLILSNSAVWFNRYIFNSENFTSTAMQSITSSTSREAIATEITERVLQNRPVLKNIVDDQSIKVISGLLEGDRVQSLLKKTISRLQTAVTSEKPQAVVIDLEGIKDALSVAASINSQLNAGEQMQRFNPENVPDQVVLFDANRLPNIYQLGTTLMWLGPIFFIIAMIFLAIPIIRSYNQKEVLKKVFFLEGVIIIVGALLALLIGPIFRPLILGRIPSTNIRTVVSDLYDTFLATFNQQTGVVLIIGFVLLAAGGLTWYFSNNNIKLPNKR